MPADASIYGLQQPVKINTPFENLAKVLQVRNQQEAAAGLREQRQSMAAQHAEQTDKLARENADVEAIDAAYAAGGEFDDIIKRAPGHLRSVIAKQLNEASEFNTKAQTAKQAAEKAELEYAAHLASGVLYWKKDGPEAMMNAAQTALAVAKKHGHDVSPIESVLQDPARLEPMLEAIIARHQGPQAPVKPPATVSPGQGVLNQQTGKYDIPIPEPTKPVTYGAPQTLMVMGRRSAVRAGSDGRMYDMNLKPIAGEAIAPEPKGDGLSPERPSVWVSKDGESRYVTPSSAGQLSTQGWKPASTREQGRPVTSGDAGRIADLDTSLDDLKVLEDTLGTTGAGSKVGAMLPNAVTEFTGWGADSKARQGTIDRVKQVIGKALEGGVLRKEDEIKYEKILPTIGDPPSVAKAKLQGLKSALIQRRQTTLDALSDAGYDTGRFSERGAPKPTAAPPAANGRIRVVGPNGETGTVPDNGAALPAGWKRAAG